MSIPNVAFVAFSSDGKLSAQRHSKKSMDRNRVLALNMAIAGWPEATVSAGFPARHKAKLNPVGSRIR
ncbi:hypothetical protein [Brucella intermedia]|uniref:hypothetical protein n=1 Tax=Brucella intermedia TaxID=94625 RepID=UPI00124DADE5|nr:hypothetical protein [Brucella intermedia]KAB2729464.1 hypothetical protein F9L02_15115 [Brucella intermedia]